MEKIAGPAFGNCYSLRCLPTPCQLATRCGRVLLVTIAYLGTDPPFGPPISASSTSFTERSLAASHAPQTPAIACPRGNGGECGE